MNFTIGLLFDSLYDEYEHVIWQEIINLAKKRKINIISFALGAIDSPYEQNAKRNILYKLITERNLDGIISFTACLGNFTSEENIIQRFKQFQSIPIVSIGTQIKEQPAILIDNEVGMSRIIDHLVNHHHCRRIAFIKGPDGNQEAELRFKIYQEYLQTHKIPLDDNLILQGDFCRLSGAKAIATLLDEKKVAIDSLDAVVSANDYMALDAMIELEKRGIHVPGDIAVTGFDDMFESRCTLHPITTVRVPSYQIASDALNMILDIMHGREVESRVILPAKAVFRRSCGCLLYMVSESNIPDSLSSLKQKVIQEMNFNFPESIEDDQKKNWMDRIVQALEMTVQPQNENDFLTTLETILIESYKKDVNPLSWFPVISSLYNLMQTIHPDKHFLDLLWKDSLVLIGNIAEHAQANIRISTRIQNYNLHLNEEAFRNIFDLKKQKALFTKHLPQVGISHLFLGIYPSKDELKKYALGTDNLEYVKIISWYDNHTFKEIHGQPLSIHEFLAKCIKTEAPPQIFTVFPIHSDLEQLGIAVIGVGPVDGTVYETLASQLNATISEATLFSRVQKHADELEEQVLARTKEISDLNEELELKSKLDGLTALYNRTAIYEFLEKGFKVLDKAYLEKDEPKQTRRTFDQQTDYNLDDIMDKKLTNFSVIMIDIDNFKRVNDTYGHLFGDAVLKRLGSLLKRSEIFRRFDVSGRFGGEEFIIILPFTEPEEAMYGAQRLQARLKEEKISYRNKPGITITLSMGISKYYPHDPSIEAVINRADMALYYAKGHGRDQIINYTDIFGEKAPHNN